MGSRHPDKDMQKSWWSFDTTVKLCKQAHSKQNLKRYETLLKTLESTFYKFDEDWRVYKEDVIKKTCKTEEAFNGDTEFEGVPVPSFQYNDKWADEQMESFIETRELLQEVLDQQSAGGGVGDTALAAVDAEFAVSDIKTDIKSLGESVEKLKLEIEGYEDHEMPVSTFMGYENIITKLSSKIETDLRAKVLTQIASNVEPTDPEYSNQKLRLKFGTFVETNKTMLHTCSMTLVKKVVHTQGDEEKHQVHRGAQGNEACNTADYKAEKQVYLEKSKPPQFSGEDLDFPEFKRKWLSQVNKANLPEETELDKLRDNIPKDAKDQLYGVVKLDEAWNILAKRFGDKQLISKKLKSQLKNIHCVGKSDPEKIINLKIKVRNIVTRLETMGMGSALTHDSEFLSAVYTALPDRHRVRWLDFEKEDDHWASMLKFLDKAYDQANQELALLLVYKEDTKKDVRAAGTNVESADSTEDPTKTKFQDVKKKARESCGKCPGAISSIPGKERMVLGGLVTGY